MLDFTYQFWLQVLSEFSHCALNIFGYVFVFPFKSQTVHWCSWCLIVSQQTLHKLILCKIFLPLFLIWSSFNFWDFLCPLLIHLKFRLLFRKLYYFYFNYNLSSKKFTLFSPIISFYTYIFERIWYLLMLTGKIMWWAFT